ncbi:hypothetical protein SBC2_85710 (plasmid) [Caballeronia sp. SBC2]|nr:hypothetical protein SBC2_85710 [Caballeronia sp. SBC2]
MPGSSSASSSQQKCLNPNTPSNIVWRFALSIRVARVSSRAPASRFFLVFGAGGDLTCNLLNVH